MNTSGRNHAVVWGVKCWHFYTERDNGEVWYCETVRRWFWQVPFSIAAVEIRRFRARRRWAKQAAAAAAASKRWHDEIPF